MSPPPASRRPTPHPVQAERGVVFASYMVKVDTISAIRTTRAEMDQLWSKVLKDADAFPVVSAIAFRGQNRSEPHLLRSNASAQSEGTGIVEQLSLLVSWNRGSFDGFQWYNQGPCDGCGGLSGARCVQTQYESSYQRYPESACASECRSGGCGGRQAGRKAEAGWALHGAAVCACVHACCTGQRTEGQSFAPLFGSCQR